MKKRNTTDMALIALMAAVLCILAPVSIPLGFTPIPITLATFAVQMAGILLGKFRGTASVFIFILLGAVGLPVFSGYTGGIAKIAGPTGGYIWGYLCMAWSVGFFVERFSAKRSGMYLGAVIGAVLGLAVCDAFGTAWMAIQMQMGPMEALVAGILPFLPLDAVKIVIAAVACCPVRMLLIQQNLIPLPETKK